VRKTANRNLILAQALRRLTPANKQDLLFDELLWVAKAALGHDEALAAAGARSPRCSERVFVAGLTEQRGRPRTLGPYGLPASDALCASIECMPRTTLDIDASVLRELKRRGRRERKSLGQLASELLARALAQDETSSVPPPLDWPSQDLRARVDLEDKDAVWQLLDER